MNDGANNNFQSKTGSTIAWLHGVTFALFSMCNIFISTFFIPWLDGILPAEWHDVFTQLIALVLDIGLYTAIYFLCRTVYSVIKFKIQSPNMNLHGVWYHVHVPTELNPNTKHNEEYIRDFLRAGTVTINQNMFELSVVGINFKAIYDPTSSTSFRWQTDEEIQTRWSYNANSFIDENSADNTVKLYACYRANSTNTDVFKGNQVNAKRLGVHDLTILDKTHIEGDYLDTYPSNKKGKIYFFRSRAERDERMKQYFELYASSLKKTQSE